jgi:cytochrome c556
MRRQVWARSACAFLSTAIPLVFHPSEGFMHSRVSSVRRSVSSRSLVPAIALATSALSAFVVAPRLAWAQAAPADEAVIEYRQHLMSAVGYNMGAIGTIMKNQLVLPGAVSNHAQQMADAAKLIAPAFERKVTAGKTDAKPEIWQDWAKFERAIADYRQAAADLAAAAKGSDPAATGAAVKALGESCGGCHESFRKPKEESYKNR